MKDFLNRLFDGDAGRCLSAFLLMIWVMAAIAVPIVLKFYGEDFFVMLSLIADAVNIPSLVVYLRIVQGKDKPGTEK